MSNRDMEHLFKYRSFDESGRSVSALVNRELWFSTGDRFNDPFDCTMNLPMVLASSKSVRNFIFESTSLVSKLKVSGIHAEKINEIVNRTVESILSDPKSLESEGAQIIYEIISGNLKNALVFCLSKTESNTLLWSHYAEFHTGFCVRFKKSKLLDSVEIYHHDDIDYTAKPFNVVEDVTDTDGLHIAKIICFRKSPDWKYEQEYRLIHRELSTIGSLAKPFCYPCDVVDEIYFGVNALSENKIKLMDALKGQNIIFRDMVIPTDNMTYELQVGPVLKLENELTRHS
jgi:hypothetical protein